MTKPWKLHRDMPNPEEPGDGADEADKEGEVKEQGRDGEGGGGKERAAQDTPLPPAEAAAGAGRANWPAQRERIRQRIRSPRGQRRRRRRMERPQGGPKLRSLAWGGMPPPQRKTQTSWDSTLNVRTCCCREFMEASRITRTGRT